MHTFTILCLFILAILSTKAFGRSLRGDDTEGEEGAQSSMASSINKVEEKPIIAEGHDKQIIKATNIMAKALGDKNVAVNTERTMKRQKFTKDPDSIKRTLMKTLTTPSPSSSRDYEKFGDDASCYKRLIEKTLDSSRKVVLPIPPQR